MENEEKLRENIITSSREIIRISKQLIYSLHRTELKEAKILFLKINNKKKELVKLIEKIQKLKYSSIYSVAIQEV